MSEARPNKLTPEMAMRAARATAGDLAKIGLIDPEEIDAHAIDIAKYGRRHRDGYELAKDLDNYCYWNCDLQMAEELDVFSEHARHEIETAEKEWASKNAITPPFPNGTRVKLKTGEVGTIDEVYAYGVAKFLIKIDGDRSARPPTNSRRIVNFEDVQIE